MDQATQSEPNNTQPNQWGVEFLPEYQEMQQSFEYMQRMAEQDMPEAGKYFETIRQNDDATLAGIDYELERHDLQKVHQQWDQLGKPPQIANSIAAELELLELGRHKFHRQHSTTEAARYELGVVEIKRLVRQYVLRKQQTDQTTDQGLLESRAMQNINALRQKHNDRS